MGGAVEWGIVDRGSLLRDPARYSFSWPGGRERADLEVSLQRFGVLHPILVSEEPQGLRVVAGHRRLAFLEAVGGNAVPVRVMGQVEEPGLWDLLLEEQRRARPLNPVEVGTYLLCRERDTGEAPEVLAEQVHRALGLSPRPGAADAYRWIAALPPEHRDAFADGRFPTNGVGVLARAPRGDALAVLDLLGSSRHGWNKFPELSRWILECAWRDGLGAAEWIERSGLPRPGADPEKLRREVRRHRYPELQAWEEDFARDVAAAALPGEVRLHHPRSFEGRRLSCTIGFSSVPALRETLRGLQEAAADGRLDGLERYLR